jgi:hypothetical protein
MPNLEYDAFVRQGSKLNRWDWERFLWEWISQNQQSWAATGHHGAIHQYGENANTYVVSVAMGKCGTMALTEVPAQVVGQPSGGWVDLVALPAGGGETLIIEAKIKGLRLTGNAIHTARDRFHRAQGRNPGACHDVSQIIAIPQPFLRNTLFGAGLVFLVPEYRHGTTIAQITNHIDATENSLLNAVMSPQNPQYPLCDAIAWFFPESMRLLPFWSAGWPYICPGAFVLVKECPLHPNGVGPF